jgi:hypothetical protein
MPTTSPLKMVVPPLPPILTSTSSPSSVSLEKPWLALLSVRTHMSGWSTSWSTTRLWIDESSTCALASFPQRT